MSTPRPTPRDGFRVTVPITRAATGAPLDLTGRSPADFEALLGKPGQPGAPGTVTVIDASGGIVQIIWPPGALVAPQSLLQLHLTHEGVKQLVAEDTIAVAPAILPPA